MRLWFLKRIVVPLMVRLVALCSDRASLRSIAEHLEAQAESLRLAGRTSESEGVLFVANSYRERLVRMEARRA